MNLLDTLDGEIQEEQQLSVKKDLSPVEDAGDYVIVRDISCIGADGNVFEQYDELWVPKDVELDNGAPAGFSAYKGITHFEAKGDDWFLPSSALTLNYLLKILPAAVKKRSDGNYAVINGEFKKVLDRYFRIGGVYAGWHVQNTIIAYGTNEIIHYPLKNDFSHSGGELDINLKKDNTRLRFNRSELYNSFNLKNKHIKHFVRQYSGLAEPEKLVDLGDYYGWLSKGYGLISLEFPWNGRLGKNFPGICSSLVCCGPNYFYPYYNGNLGQIDSAAGVRSFQP